MRKLWLLAFMTLLPAWGEDGSDFGWGERFRNYVNRTYGWQRMALLVTDTALDQLTDEPREWGRGPATFGYRYSSSFGSRMVRNSLEFAAGGLLGEDNRLRPSGAPKFGRRVRHAFRQALFTHGYRPSYSRMVATAGGIAVTSTWHPGELNLARVAEAVGFSYVDQLQNSLLVEFGPDMKRWGRGLRLKLFRR